MTDKTILVRISIPVKEALELSCAQTDISMRAGMDEAAMEWMSKRGLPVKEEDQ